MILLLPTDAPLPCKILRSFEMRIIHDSKDIFYLQRSDHAPSVQTLSHKRVTDSPVTRMRSCLHPPSDWSSETVTGKVQTKDHQLRYTLIRNYDGARSSITVTPVNIVRSYMPDPSQFTKRKNKIKYKSNSVMSVCPGYKAVTPVRTMTHAKKSNV